MTKTMSVSTCAVSVGAEGALTRLRRAAARRPSRPLRPCSFRSRTERRVVAGAMLPGSVGPRPAAVARRGRRARGRLRAVLILFSPQRGGRLLDDEKLPPSRHFTLSRAPPSATRPLLRARHGTHRNPSSFFSAASESGGRLCRPGAFEAQDRSRHGNLGRRLAPSTHHTALKEGARGGTRGSPTLYGEGGI